MAIDPNLAMTAISALSGLFGSKPKWDENQRQQMRIAGDLENYARGVPGSDPQEAYSLAQGRALMGQDQLNARNRMYSALSPNATTDLGDFMRNLESSQQADRASFDIQQMLQFLNNRRQSLLSAAQVAGSVGPKGSGGQQNNLPQLVGQYIYQRELNKANQPSGQGVRLPGTPGTPGTPPPAGHGGLFAGPPSAYTGAQAARPAAPFALPAPQRAMTGGAMGHGMPGAMPMPTWGPMSFQDAGPALTGPNTRYDPRRSGPPRNRTRF